MGPGLRRDLTSGPRTLLPGSLPMTSPPAPAAQAPAAAPAPGAPSPGTTAQAPTTPPSWQQGRPEAEAAVKLAPVPALPIATAIDKLPVTKLSLPKGFNIE